MIVVATALSLSACGCKRQTDDILFWNVDTQIDFMKANGKLYVQNAEAIAPTLAKLTEFAKENDIRVVNSCDYHNENSAELSNSPDFIATFPPHCMQNTEGQNFISETNPEHPIVFDWDKQYTIDEEMLAMENARNIVIRKDLFDVFAGNPNTEKIVETLAPQKVFVYGVATNVCVNFAVVGLADRGYEVFVIQDAIQELPKIPVPFELWRQKGVTLIQSEEVTDYL